VVYLFAEDRKGRHVAEHLTGFNGVLQVDAYTGYAALVAPRRAGRAITLAFCLAHARRKFFDAYKRSACAVSGRRCAGWQRSTTSKPASATALPTIALQSARPRPDRCSMISSLG
jgi:hypothetical protein